MSIPNEALQKLIQEIELQANTSLQQINVCKGQIQHKVREVRLSQLTADEVRRLGDHNVYEGVGKMFVQNDKKSVLARIEKEEKDLKDEKLSLEKKLEYYEKTFEKSKENIDMILKGPQK
ncbi:hypothetical protein BJ508DRAFT_325240 [Ascobolus immersus RN42]|uniref:Prefoldin n=1 Tax=Ascobolus immersus RN42 TaxID=1160509 RepID=A0A3N4IBE7_ASCIM|nr:hypothetical protein BJ508DRAFT_325240 [Ascobolus immersus RN42]